MTSEFSSISNRRTPAQTACTIPAGTKSASPGFTAIRLRHPSTRPSASARVNSSRPSPGRSPQSSAAPRSAAATYQSSVFPHSPRSCPAA